MIVILTLIASIALYVAVDQHSASAYAVCLATTLATIYSIAEEMLDQWWRLK